MDLLVLNLVEVDAKLCGVGTDVAKGDGRRLLHHIAEATGEDELTILPRLEAAFDEEDLPSDARPR